MAQVTTLLRDMEKVGGADRPSAEDLVVMEQAVSQQGALVRDAKQRAKADPSDAAKAEVRPCPLSVAVSGAVPVNSTSDRHIALLRTRSGATCRSVEGL